MAGHTTRPEWHLAGGIALLSTLLALSGVAKAEECAVMTKLDAFASSGIGPDGATCRPYTDTAGRIGTACHWPFNYRDPEARRFMDQMWAGITTCRDGQPRQHADQVNHPDSYDLREWLTSTATYALSLKDKGNLAQSFVFLRREAN